MSRNAIPERLAAQAVESAIADPVNEVRRRYECVTLLGTSAAPAFVSDSLEVVRVTATATATLPLSHAAGEFPAHWLVTLRRAGDTWRVERVAVAEAAVAEAIIAAPDVASRWSVLREDPSLITPELARRISGRADILDGAGRSPLAIELTEIARTIAAECGSGIEEARAIGVRGKASSALNRLDEALKASEEARRMAEEAGDLDLAATALTDIGLTRTRAGVMESSELAAAYRLAKQLSNHKIAGRSLFLLGEVDEAAGNYAEAVKKLAEATREAEAADDLPTVAAATSETGMVYSYMNNPAAWDFARRGVELYRRAGNMRGVIRMMRNLADMEAAGREYEKAERHLKEVEALLQKYPNGRTSAFVAATRADMAVQRHDTAAAERASTAGLAYARQAGVESLVTIFSANMASIRLEQKRYEEAAALARETIERTRTKTENFDTYWHTELTLGAALIGLGRMKEARQAYGEAIDAVERGRDAAGPQDDQTMYFSDKDAPYVATFRTYIEEDPGEAVLWVERARAHSALLDLLARGRRTASAASLSEGERAEEEGIEKKLVDLNLSLRQEKERPSPDAARVRQLQESLEAARHERAVLQLRLYEAHPDLALARGDVPLPSIDEVRGMIPADGLVVEYVMLESQVWVVALTRDAPPKIYPLDTTPVRLQALCKRFTAQIAARDVRVRALSRKLFDLLLGPARAELRRKSILCVVAVDVLWSIPFQALRDRDGRYLVERHPVFYAPSLAFLVWRSRHHRDALPPATLLAFGNPRVSETTATKARARFRDESLGPLPEAEQEVRILASAYGRRNTTLRVGAAATETEFKKSAGRYRILHVATHGIYDDKDPMYSHLVLSRAADDGNDGLLEAREIVDLHLDADLAVLSACETGRGEARGGEGLVGLAWAFFVAGTRTELLVQMKVGSAATRDLMVSFHRQLAGHHALGARAATAALQRAQLAMLAGGARSHPFYWAPFIVVGEGW